MKPRIKYPIIVEGKYDKNTLCQIFNCMVLVTGGFGIFNAKEKQALLRRIAEGGVIFLPIPTAAESRYAPSFRAFSPRIKYITFISRRSRARSAARGPLQRRELLAWREWTETGF